MSADPGKASFVLIRKDLETGSDQSLHKLLDKNPEAALWRDHSDKNQTLLHYLAKYKVVKPIDHLIEWVPT